MHELAHAIFDIESEAAAIDFRDEVSETDVKEVRAEAFAAETLVSSEMLRHLQSMLGLHWDALSVENLASLVAYSQVELKILLRSARDYGFIGAGLVERAQTPAKRLKFKSDPSRPIALQRAAGAEMLQCRLG